MPSKNRICSRLLIGMMLILGMVFVSSCSSSTGDGETEDGEHEANGDSEDTHEEGDHDDMNHDDSDRIPNDGAVIHIVGPADESVFSVDDDIVIEVEVLGFDLAMEGNHWHVYVDGTSFGMVTGGDTDKVLRGLEPGEHLVEVYIAGGDHFEFEEGDRITISVQ